MVRRSLTLVLLLAATPSHADGSFEDRSTHARKNILWGKIGVAAGVTLAAAGGALVYYYGDYCGRTGHAEDCHVAEIVYPIFIGTPLIGLGAMGTYVAARSWISGARELRAMRQVGFAPIRGGALVTFGGAF